MQDLLMYYYLFYIIVQCTIQIKSKILKQWHIINIHYNDAKQQSKILKKQILKKRYFWKINNIDVELSFKLSYEWYEEMSIHKRLLVNRTSYYQYIYFISKTLHFEFAGIDWTQHCNKPCFNIEINCGFFSFFKICPEGIFITRLPCYLLQ